MNFELYSKKELEYIKTLPSGVIHDSRLAWTVGLIYFEVATRNKFICHSNGYYNRTVDSYPPDYPFYNHEGMLYELPNIEWKEHGKLPICTLCKNQLNCLAGEVLQPDV